ncbi:unnamed protein product [Rotaria sp. Silwood2]|nr:unnamed protein product [Rotaria sp. Silwood2]CAF3059953.1 unnamed protein product [Rotaria sp. Silwood2]CAF3332066.1 unnamed protein product [Rotaria sp. Silwood2]CAF3405144.1 unnamed protein product [Rotaria sp. Silwood2]CAF4270798.1 unnamed protein product [Rotaria sp. Silwood2]
MLTLNKFRLGKSKYSNVCKWLTVYYLKQRLTIRTFRKFSFLSYQQQDKPTKKTLNENFNPYPSNSWDFIVPNQLKEMFTFAEYSSNGIINNLNFYHKFIAPYLGPEPCSPKAEWKSYINDDYSPIEMTYSFKTNDKHPTVKCIFEPIEKNQYNGQLSNISASLKFLAAMKFAKLPINYDILLLLIESFCIENFHQDNYHLCFGFDFQDNESDYPLIKAYVGSNSDRSPGSVPMHHHVSKIMNLLKLNKAWKCVCDYLKILTNDNCPSDIDCFSVDCLDNNDDNLRIKVYIRYFTCEKNDLIQHLTLNNRLSNTNIDFNYVLKQWDYFLNNKKISCLNDNNVTKSFLVYYEFNQSKPDCPISAKFYFPIRHYIENDQFLTYKIAKYLNGIGFEKYGGMNYINHINNLCKHRPLDKRTGFHRLTAGSLSKENLEFKLYYSPELYAAERFEFFSTSR